MKKQGMILLLFLGAYLLGGCAGTPATEGLMSLEEAMSGAVAEVEQ